MVRLDECDRGGERERGACMSERERERERETFGCVTSGTELGGITREQSVHRFATVHAWKTCGEAHSLLFPARLVAGNPRSRCEDRVHTLQALRSLACACGGES